MNKKNEQKQKRQNLHKISEFIEQLDTVTDLDCNNKYLNK